MFPPPGLRVSPFRIVRIVDREGQIQSIRQNAETVLECSRQGYYRHPEDCSRWVQSVTLVTTISHNIACQVLPMCQVQPV